MAATPPFTVITADGDYEFSTRDGRLHLLTLKGTFGGATVTLTTYNEATAAYTSVSGGSWTDEAEVQFYAPSGTARLNFASSSGTTSVAVNLLPIYNP